MNWYLQAVTANYANFSDRARRKEYWMFVLFNIIFSVVAMFLDNMLGLAFTMDMEGMSISLGYGWIYSIYALAVLIPALSVTVRRLHDKSKSGWFIFIALIPLIGAIWLFVLMCLDSDPGDNAYGPYPK